jgi:hypothetical protein
MRKIVLTYLLLIGISVELSAQQIPTSYSVESNRLLKTSDSTPTSSTPASNSVERILIQDNVIWIGTGNGLSKSTDNGATWTNYYKTDAFGTEGISAVGYSSGTIWAATWHAQTVSGSTIGVGSGLKYSTNNGTTWNTIDQPVDSKTDTVITYGSNKLKANPTTVPQENFIYDLAFTTNTIWYAAKAGGLRKSTDMGKTWQKIVLPPDNLDSIKPTDVLTFKYDPAANLNHLAYSVLAIDDYTIYVGTADGINKSTDGGISWTKFTQSNQTKPISGNFVLSLRKNDYDNSIWAGTWKANGQSEFYGVSVSKDGGLSWDNFLSGEKIHDFGFKYFGNTGSYTGSDVFAAAETGLYRSSNYGTTWISAPEIKDDNTNVEINTKHFLSVKTNRKSDNSTDIWIGSNNGLAKLNEATTGFWSGAWTVFLASESLASTSESYAFPNPFSPNREVTKIKYSLSQTSNVTIRIFDFGMNLVRTIIQNTSRSFTIQQLEVWDGRGENGKIVPNGVYFYRIDIGSEKPLFGKIISLM